MKLISPYRNIKQHTCIALEPHQLNSDIINNLKSNVKDKIENKCNKNGFIIEVYRIMEYSDGIMHPENLNGAPIYNITYQCKMCCPVENTIIIGFIKVINQELVFAENGPIIIFIPKGNIDSNEWDIPDQYMHKKTHKRLMNGNYVKIEIVDKRINENDTQIKTIGRLIDFATEQEVETYYGLKVLSEKTQEPESTSENKSNFII